MNERSTASEVDWKTIFEDQNQREAYQAYIRSIISLERLEKVILLRLPDDSEKLYLFFPSTELTPDGMTSLGEILDESFRVVEDPHQWANLIEMTDEEYDRIRRDNPKIKSADKFVLWGRGREVA